MNQCINKADTWLKSHPKVKQWLWFITLWCGGLLTVFAVSYPIKLLIKSL
ncbi:hypothetical protein N9W34_04650 [Rickettsiales bacterium]|nr:hypothetical protein [Rickettsiales bacterium]